MPSADELFRTIYTRGGTGVSEVLAVTSAIAGEGKTTVSLGLAVTIAQDFPDRRVLLVETDIEHPNLARDFEIDPSPGLVDYLLDDRSLEAIFRPTSLDNLYILPSGGPITNPGRLLRSNQMVTAIETMRETHDIVILDLSAILVNSDALPLTDLADGVIFVVRAGVTPTNLVNKSLRLIDDTKMLGVVLNGVRSYVPGWLRRLSGMG
jgi:capsular exopolysaccharide synthesis family protein